MKPRGNRPSGRSRTRWLDQVREDIKKREQDWMEMQATKHGMMEMAGDFSPRTDPRNWKRLKEEKIEKEEVNVGTGISASCGCRQNW